MGRRQSQLRCGEPDQAVGQTANGRRTGLRSSACTDEKNVPSPSANMLILRIVNLGTIAETVAVLGRAFGQLVVQRDRIDPKLRQSVQLLRFGHAIVVCVLPQKQFRENRVATVDDAVGVSIVGRFVVFSQREKAVALNAKRRVRLRGKVSK